MDFISSNLPLILFFLAGFGLLLTEAFMPGFGVAGVLGIVLEVLAVYSAWLHHGPVPALILTLDTEAPAETPARETLQAFVGREGVAVTPLRPAGQVDLDGKRVNAASGGEFLVKGARVRVTGAEGDHVVVRPAED